VKHRRAILFCCVFALFASFALARIHPFGDAGLQAPRGPRSTIQAAHEMPPELRAILVEKCANCHSNQPNAPLYSQFAPVSWLLERDVTEARKAMNLSEWDSYSADKRQTLLAQIIHETKTGAMPPLQYRMIHWRSRITDADLRVLSKFRVNSDLKAASLSRTGTADPAHGMEIFRKRCTGCHSLEQNHEGPRLLGVYGRPSGSLPDFAYSTALKKAHVVWDESSLDRWLTDPDAFLPGNEMDFLVSNPQERHDLISYLRQTSGK
jgi:cytochrome c